MTTAIDKPRFEIDDIFWLFAKTYEIDGREGLIVYRSAALHDDSRKYLDVLDVLSSNGFELVARAEVPDDMMMFARAELSLYALGTGPTTAEFVDELWAECGRSIYFADGLPR